ncbi:MAG: hypothetical protein ACJAYE_002171 [Candidatus Azotimanducaceae bacterium]|jgi:hypothetical protein
MDLVSHIEQWVEIIIRWHHPHAAIATLHASQDQLARFFERQKTLARAVK